MAKGYASHLYEALEWNQECDQYERVTRICWCPKNHNHED